MSSILRSFAAVVDDVNKTERSVVAKINCNSIDRYNTVIDARGADLKNYVKCPVVLFEHGKDRTRGMVPVGKNLWVRADRGTSPKIIAKTQFAKDDFSQNLYDLYEDGTMTGWSISLIPRDFGPPKQEEVRSNPAWKDVDTIFRVWDMIEYSAVACPGNPDCLTEQELRSLAAVVSRGVPVPDALIPVLDRMSEGSGLANGGALVAPETPCTSEEADDEDGDANGGNLGDDADRCSSGEGVEDRFIKKVGSEWGVFTKDGKLIAKHKDREGAVKQLQAIEAHKHDKSVSNAEPDYSHLPPLVGRSMTSVMLEMLGFIQAARKNMAEEIQAYNDWLHGKA